MSTMRKLILITAALVLLAAPAHADRSWTIVTSITSHATDCTAGGVSGSLGELCVDLDDGKLWTCTTPAGGGAAGACDNVADWLQTGGAGVGTGDITEVTANSPLTGGGTSGAVSLGCQAASGAQAGCLSSTDWTTFNNKIDSSGNAATATALAANGANCSAGQAPLGVDASGAAESCFAVTTASSTDAFTNKTYDAEATGNVLTTPSEWQIPIVSCAGTTGAVLWDTLATLAPAATCAAGTTNTAMMRGTVDYPDSDGLYSIQTSLTLPIGWTGNVDFYGKWRTALTSGNVVWQLQTACTADAEVDDVAWNTAQTVTETAKGVASQLNDFSQASLTMTGCAAGEMLHVRIGRDRTHASDTIGAGVVSLAGPIRLVIRRAL